MNIAGGFVAISVIAVACATPAILTPPLNNWPCGYHGHSCGNGLCCSDYEDCGSDPDAGFSTCPPGSCCYNGEDTYVGGSRKVIGPQWRVPLQ
jgi:hypothetical protein